jgi:hypothetical protein
MSKSKRSTAKGEYVKAPTGLIIEVETTARAAALVISLVVIKAEDYVRRQREIHRQTSS